MFEKQENHDVFPLFQIKIEPQLCVCTFNLGFYRIHRNIQPLCHLTIFQSLHTSQYKNLPAFFRQTVHKSPESLPQYISVLNRLDEASEMFELSEVNIQKLVGEIEKECSKEMEEKKITTEVALPGNPTIYGNYSLLYSIFRNLYDNAIAYAGEGIHLTVSCYKEDPKFYYFSFSDNGIGVSEEHVNRIFERFYRVDKGRSRKVGGTGLGLSIVKNGINFHKGQISAKSGLGKGMTFFFTLKKKI